MRIPLVLLVLQRQVMWHGGSPGCALALDEWQEQQAQHESWSIELRIDDIPHRLTFSDGE